MPVNFRGPRNVRRDTRMSAGKFKGGKLAPVMAVPVRESEGGMLTQDITMELDPIAGRMLTPITASVTCVFVPVQAMHALRYSDKAYPGAADVIRSMLLAEQPLFGVTGETEISRRCDVVPRSVGGVKSVSEAVHIGHNAAVNYLRQRKYVNAALLPFGNTSMSPALIGNTALDRLNGVLDPEDRVDGKVDFTGKIPVSGLVGAGAKDPVTGEVGYVDKVIVGSGNNWLNLRRKPNSTGGNIADLWADLGAADGVSLRDFYRAERMDKLTRQMRGLVDANPQFGEELAVRWAYGLSVDAGPQCFVLYEREVEFGTNFRRATDGAGMDTARTEGFQTFSFAVPIPKTEFGGMIYTFLSVKPDETISSQPHPLLTSPWVAQNFVKDEMALDPVPVLVRDLNGDCLPAQEETVVMYIGNNRLREDYRHWGWNRQLDPTTVEAKTAVWQLDVPLSVTPESVIYPADLPQYPFVDQLAEICTYSVQSRAVIQTPMIFGPLPVEELAQIETVDVFGDAE